MSRSSLFVLSPRRSARRFVPALLEKVPGMSQPHFEAPRNEHPVDTIERLATCNQWSFDREDEDEISISVRGSWSDYDIAFTWLDELEALHVACAFDLKVPEPRLADVTALVALVNEQLWIGHFELWPREGLVLFRHALLLAGGAELNGRQCQCVLAAAVEACERYFQAFQFVVWAGKSGREAMAIAMLETQGHA
jgi:hypothetical protein